MLMLYFMLEVLVKLPGEFFIYTFIGERKSGPTIPS